MTPICLIQTPFKEKFAVPRQPLLAKAAWGRLEFPKNDFYVEAFRGIEEFSHLWLTWSFHQATDEGVKALVRPPRFKGSEKWGVFATRSPHRPNHLGLSVVEFDRLEVTKDKVILWVRGVDLVTGTPIMDIKPYIPYVDAIPEAKGGPFSEAPVNLAVVWNVPAMENRASKELIEQVIALDPRTSYDQSGEYGLTVDGYNVRFQFIDEAMRILSWTKE